MSWLRELVGDVLTFIVLMLLGLLVVVHIAVLCIIVYTQLHL